MSRRKDEEPSSLLMEEHFTAGNAKFLEELFRLEAPGKLKAFAPRWYADQRPFARDALLTYVDEGGDRRKHRVLVKTLFKLAEKNSDDELLAHFVVTFDRILRHQLKKRRRWDYSARKYVEHQVMSLQRGIPTNKWWADQDGRFSMKTRRYLQRRATRYFRYLGKKDPQRFLRAATVMLALYRNDQLQTAENLLDAWGLVHLLYHRSPVFKRGFYGVQLRAGRALSELSFAPMHEAVWQQGFDELMFLLTAAQAKPVRDFVIAQLKAHHAARLRALPSSHLRSLLQHQDPAVAVLALSAFRESPELPLLPLHDWLELLRVDSAEILAELSALFEKIVDPKRLSLTQAVQLAMLRPSPVAEAGFRAVQGKPIDSEAALAELTPLANAPCAMVREKASAYLTTLFREKPFVRPERVRDMLDSKYSEPRAAAMELLKSGSRFSDETMLWAALVESPYNDVQTFLVSHLEDRAGIFTPDETRGLWATVLLAVHRGGKAKPLALRQLADRIADKPNEAEQLLPLAAIALRSIRAPERRAALSAVTRAVFKVPALRSVVQETIPELVLFSAEAAV